jgi:beta-glucuronidase
MRLIKSLLLAGSLLIGSSGLLDAEVLEATSLANVGGRTTVELDGPWSAIVDPYDAGRINYRNQPYADGYFKDAKPRDASDRVEYDFDSSGRLAVPGDWNSQRPELLLYEGPVWYRRLFDLAPRADKRYFLHFGAANHTARVYLNGDLIGEHQGGFTPFVFEITDRLLDGSNTLVVHVDNTRRQHAVPTLMTDWWNYGGITRPVRIFEVQQVFIRDYFLALERDRKTVTGWVRLDGAALEQQVTVDIARAGVSYTARADASGLAPIRFEAELELWSPESPTLYDVTVSIDGDRITDQIGFRTIEVDGTEILLNGEPIFLRGISIHEEAPFRGGRAHSKEDAQTLLGWVKELGGNFARLAHYPHNETMVREADRMGILIWSEIPVYWVLSWDRPETLDTALQQLTENISRDRNRASVILWSVANETPVSSPRNEFLAALIARARELDSSRLITAALEARWEDETTRVIDDPIGAELDVMGNNEYIGWYDGLPEKCDRMSWKSPYEKPLIMSEFGGGALAGHHGDPLQRWTEEYQELLYQRQLAMLKRIPFLRGTTPWILMDFRSPRRPLPVIQDFWNRKGLVSETGQRKKAFRVLQDFYKELADR